MPGRTGNRQPGPANRILALAFACLILIWPSICPAGWKAGVARRNITPEGPIWMAGYSSRKSPSEGALHDLWAKALALEDGAGRRAVLITLDVCGIGRPLSLAIRERLRADHHLDRDQIVIACSHTHTGPVVGTNLIGIY